MPLPPGLCSTMIGRASVRAMCSATSRPYGSVAPPAASGITSRIGRPGANCASAGPVLLRLAAKAAIAARKARRSMIGPSGMRRATLCVCARLLLDLCLEPRINLERVALVDLLPLCRGEALRTVDVAPRVVEVVSGLGVD